MVEIIKEIKQNKQGFCSVSLGKPELKKLEIEDPENEYVVIKKLKREEE